MNVILMGAPGAGKGTQAKILMDKLGTGRLATGDLLRAAVTEGTPLGREAQQYMDRGDLIPDDVMLGIVETSLASEDAAPGVVMDGFPRTISQAEGLDRLLAARGTQVDKVVKFDVPDGELMIRLMGRAAEEGRSDDAPDIIRKRLEVFRRETAPLISYYETRGVLTTIDATGPVDEVAARVAQALGIS
jgi:adenylate kinase